MATLITTEADKQRVRAILPSWFKDEPGFKFDYDGSPAMVVGWGGYRKSNPCGTLTLHSGATPEVKGQVGLAIFQLVFKDPTLVVTYLYKGEWHLASIEEIGIESIRSK